MKTLTTADALDKLAGQIKSLEEQAEIYFLPADPYHGSNRDNDIHIAVVIDVDDVRMDALVEQLATRVEAINVELNYDPFVVAHPTNRNATFARRARENGVRL